MPNRAHQTLRILVYKTYNKAANELVADLTAAWDDLDFSTALHGGFKDCTISVPMSMNKAVLALNRNLPGWHFYHLEISENMRLVWEGRIMNVELIKSPGFQGIRLEAMGYWASMRDRLYATAGTNFADSGTLIRTIVTQKCPDINGTADIGTTGLDITGILLGTNDYPQNIIIDKIAPLSDTGTGIWYFSVYDNRKPTYAARGTANLHWMIWMQDLDILNLKQQGEHLRNSIFPFVGTATGTTTLDADSTARYVTREIIFQAPDGVAAGTANKGRDAFLNDRKLPRQDLSFSISGHAYSTQAGTATGTAGALIEAQKWHMRAGQVIRIQDLYPASQASPVLDDIRTFYILETRYNANRDIITIIPDRPMQDLQTILAQQGTLERTS